MRSVNPCRKNRRAAHRRLPRWLARLSALGKDSADAAGDLHESVVEGEPLGVAERVVGDAGDGVRPLGEHLSLAVGDSRTDAGLDAVALDEEGVEEAHGGVGVHWFFGCVGCWVHTQECRIACVAQAPFLA